MNESEYEHRQYFCCGAPTTPLDNPNNKITFYVAITADGNRFILKNCFWTKCSCHSAFYSSQMSFHFYLSNNNKSTIQFFYVRRNSYEALNVRFSFKYQLQCMKKWFNSRLWQYKMFTLEETVKLMTHLYTNFPQNSAWQT